MSELEQQAISLYLTGQFHLTEIASMLKLRIQIVRAIIKNYERKKLK